MNDTAGMWAANRASSQRRITAVLAAIAERGPLSSDGIVAACTDAGLPVHSALYATTLRRAGWLTPVDTGRGRTFRRVWGLTDKARKALEVG